MDIKIKITKFATIVRWHSYGCNHKLFEGLLIIQLVTAMRNAQTLNRALMDSDYDLLKKAPNHRLFTKLKYNVKLWVRIYHQSFNKNGTN